MKKKLCLLLIFSLTASSLAGCGGIAGKVLSKLGAHNIPIPSSVDLVPEEEDVDEDWVELGEDKPAASEDEEKKDTDIVIVKHPLTCAKDGRTLSEGSYSEIVLSKDVADKYPKLAEAVASLNETWSVETKHAISEYGYYRIQDDFTPELIYSSEIEADVVRFDEHMFTVSQSLYDFAGGAHPNHAFYYTNIDPVTGNTLELKNVIADVDGAPAAIEKSLYEQYPELKEEVTAYMNYGGDEQTVEEMFRTKLIEDKFSWTVTDKGLEIHFSPYEIASYAVGDIDVTVSYKDYPDLVQETFRLDRMPRLSDTVTKREEAEESLEPGAEDKANNVSLVTINNPAWKDFCVECYSEPDAKTITLKKTAEDKADWLDIDRWAAKNDFNVAKMPYSDGTYYYELANSIEYSYKYNELLIYDNKTMELLYDLDLYTLINGPDQIENKTSKVVQYIRWAKLSEGMLYLSVGHNEYSKNEPDSNYMVCVDLGASDVAWRSKALVSNASNFLLIGDTIVCGYGFTSENDYIYLLNATNGEMVDRIKVNSAPEQFEVSGDKLYVATYDTAYEFDIKK